MTEAVPRIRFRGLRKAFGGVVALQHVDLTVARGSCHGLMGENGAGKSTLGRILAGIHAADWGEMELDGRVVSFRSPAEAQAAGVAMVHQELAFCPDLTVAENLSLGRWPTRGPFVSRRAMAARARELLARIDADIDPALTMSRLSVAQEQLVQIAAAVGTGADVLIFDEPTSALSEGEARHLFALIEDLRDRGVTILYVSHRLPEVERLCDRVTVLRDGQVVATLDRDEADARTVVRHMIGRELEQGTPEHLGGEPGAPRLEVESLSSSAYADVSLTVHAGEIVGLAGLVGAGRSALLASVFGLDPIASGRVLVDGAPLPRGDAKAAMAAGMALVPEDRKRQGLVLEASCAFNHGLASLDRLRRGWRLDRGRERRAAQAAFQELEVRAPSVDVPASSLSGGNQQKVVLARWLAREAGVLLVDEPTRGVDVGAKASIHRLLSGQAAAGAAVLMVSSDLPELLHLCNRILVMRDGRLVGEVPRSAFSEQAVMEVMAGVTGAAAP